MHSKAPVGLNQRISGLGVSLVDITQDRQQAFKISLPAISQ
ncbi:hypothetical protein BSLA_02r1882 [Burkholderia stabilis]|nr:hypothetical protein BSLA_02r1882 [Burkholderia stabilis]